MRPLLKTKQNKKEQTKKLQNAFMKLEALQIRSQEQAEGLKPVFFHLKEAGAQARNKRVAREAGTARQTHPPL